MATSSLYGSVSESTGLYGIGAASGGTYFEWFIFYDSATAPATPTGGSWSFTTNTGTAPTGWLSAPPAAPVNQVWVSIAIVDSRNTGSLVWSIPGLMTGAGLPILTGSGAPSAGTGLNGQLYINTATTPQSMYNKQSGAWVQLTGSTVYATAGANTNITSLTGITGGISSATYVQLNTAGDGATAPGKLQWDVAWGGPQIGMAGGNVSLQVGQETVVYVFNNTAAQINEGQIVRVSGSQGQRLTVALAQADSDANSVTILGMATENIAAGASGFVTTQGMVNGLNTLGFVDGTVIYLSPTVAGAWTATKPIAPQHLVLVGYIVKGGSGGNGSVYIHTQNGYELEELHDVRVTSLANKNLLQYSTTYQSWVNIPGPNGDIVGTTDAQTLTNKTISGSSNTLVNIPNSALVNDHVTVNGVPLTLGAVQLVGADWILPSYAGNAGKVLTVNPSASDVQWQVVTGTGTVTSIDVSGGTTGLTTSGGPVVTAGTITLGGTLSIAHGGTGAATAADARGTLGLGSSAVLNAGVAGGVATLDGGGTVPTSQLPAAVLGAVKYQGTWDANANSPSLASGVGTQGYYYVVNVAGSTNLDGITDWKIGDWAIFSGTAWQKIDNTDAVSSVNGYTGTVVLGYADVGAPSTTGTNATGTWGINVTGNAGTVTNGVYTNGSYADPAWITSLAASKITGTLTNSQLLNSSLTIGTTSISLGGTSTTLAGLTSVATGVLTASSDSTFSSTGALTISKGTTAQQPASPAVGMMRYNTTTNQFEGYSGASPAWKSIGGSALSNDTATASNLYPVFASATTGTAENLYTSNANYLYKPSTGELTALAHVSSNGLTVNSATVSANYTLNSGNNALSAGPITVASGITVTVSSGSVWSVI